MIGGEDDPRLVDKNVPLNVPMEDAPGLVKSSFSEFVDSFLTDAEVIYKTLEAEDHRHQYQLIGNFVSVAIRRLPYLKVNDGIRREKYDECAKDFGQNEKVEEEGGDKRRTEQAEGEEKSTDWNPA